MIRDDKKRAMLFELDKNIQSLKSRHGVKMKRSSLLNLYHNLLRGMVGDLTLELPRFVPILATLNCTSIDMGGRY